MNHPDPRVRRGAHRTRRSPTTALLPSLLAVLAVTSLITVLYVWRGQDSAPPQASAATTQALTEPDRPLAAPTATATARASASASAANATPTNNATATDAVVPPTAVPHVAVVVLNQTARRGLAATVADRLRSRGWSVAGVGNFRGTVPGTTVYYPAGRAAAAEAVAESLPTEPRTRPRFGNLRADRLTVVVTDNYPR